MLIRRPKGLADSAGRPANAAVNVQIVRQIGFAFCICIIYCGRLLLLSFFSQGSSTGSSKRPFRHKFMDISSSSHVLRGGCGRGISNPSLSFMASCPHSLSALRSAKSDSRTSDSTDLSACGCPLSRSINCERGRGRQSGSGDLADCWAKLLMR